MEKTLQAENNASCATWLPQIHNIVAIKIIDTGNVSQPYVIKNLTREAKLLAKLQHPNILCLYETIRCSSSYYLVTELATGGDLYTHIRKQPTGHLDETTAKCYARQLVSALDHIHLQGIVHRDLKMENIMLKDARKKHIIIIDFGLSNWYNGINRLETHCGSPEYAAPELFLVGERYGPEVDTWSLGVIIYGMTTGQLPFLIRRNDKISTDEWRKKLMAQIFRGLTSLQEKRIASMSNDYKNLVRRLLQPVAHRRIPMWEICRHPWIIDTFNKNLSNISSHPPERILDSGSIDIIFDEIRTVTKLDRSTLYARCSQKPYGEIGGMFNIKAHKIRGTGSTDVFGSDSSVPRRTRTNGKVLSTAKSSLINPASEHGTSSDNPSNRRVQILKKLTPNSRKIKKETKKSSSTPDYHFRTNCPIKINDSSNLFSRGNEEKRERTNHRKIVDMNTTKSARIGIDVNARPMNQPIIRQISRQSVSASLTNTFSDNRSRPSCPGPSRPLPDDYRANVKKIMDIRDKSYRQQRHSAPAFHNHKIGRIVMPFVSTNRQTSKIATVAQSSGIIGRKFNRDRTFFKTMTDKFDGGNCRNDVKANSKFLERGKTFFRSNTAAASGLRLKSTDAVKTEKNIHHSSQTQS